MALGIGIFILVYAIGVARLVWREIFQNREDTRRRPSMPSPAVWRRHAGRGRTGHIRNRGDEDGQAHGRALPGSRKRPATKALDSSSPDAGWVDSLPTRTGPLESGQPGRTVADRYRGPGRPRPLTDMVERWGRQPILSAVTVYNRPQQWDQSFGILHSVELVGKTLAQFLRKRVNLYRKSRIAGVTRG